jgi:hypothetical protein
MGDQLHEAGGSKTRNPLQHTQAAAAHGIDSIVQASSIIPALYCSCQTSPLQGGTLLMCHPVEGWFDKNSTAQKLNALQLQQTLLLDSCPNLHVLCA